MALGVPLNYRKEDGIAFSLLQILGLFSTVPSTFCLHFLFRWLFVSSVCLWFSRLSEMYYTSQSPLPSLFFQLLLLVYSIFHRLVFLPSLTPCSPALGFVVLMIPLQIFMHVLITCQSSYVYSDYGSRSSFHPIFSPPSCPPLSSPPSSLNSIPLLPLLPSPPLQLPCIDGQKPRRCACCRGVVQE